MHPADAVAIRSRIDARLPPADRMRVSCSVPRGMRLRDTGSAEGDRAAQRTSRRTPADPGAISNASDRRQAAAEQIACASHAASHVGRRSGMRALPKAIALHNEPADEHPTDPAAIGSQSPHGMPPGRPHARLTPRPTWDAAPGHGLCRKCSRCTTTQPTNTPQIPGAIGNSGDQRRDATGQIACASHVERSSGIRLC